jgi:hypothetical protein
MAPFMTSNQLYIDKENGRRDTMVMIICIMAVIVLIGVAAASWLKGDTPLALIDITAALGVWYFWLFSGSVLTNRQVNMQVWR